MGIIGYFEGTDPLVLANLSIAGHQALPLGNGFDNYGKFVAHLTDSDKIDIVVGYFHKVIPTTDMTITVKDILEPVIKLNIPILLICGRENYGKAKELLGEIADRIRLAAPERMEETILNMIK